MYHNLGGRGYFEKYGKKENSSCFLCASVNMVLTFAAQTRLSELNDEIEKAEQQILRATEEFKQMEEAIQLKKVHKSKAAMLKGNTENKMFFLHTSCKLIFK